MKIGSQKRLVPASFVSILYSDDLGNRFVVTRESLRMLFRKGEKKSTIGCANAVPVYSIRAVGLAKPQSHVGPLLIFRPPGRI